MTITDHGLVLRETKYGESHRILTVLTKTHGILSITAKGSLNPKSKFFSAGGLYCYSEWVFQEGAKTYFAKEAAPIETFFGLRTTVENVYLAAYIAELAQFFSPVGEECPSLLRLTLNSFHVLSHHQKPPLLVKSVYEMRSMSEHGFMPDLLACKSCGQFDKGAFAFLVAEGILLCEACAKKQNITCNLGEASLLALRHIVYSENDKLFSFTLKPNSMQQLNTVTQQYILQHLHAAPRSLSGLALLLDGDTITT